MSSVGTVELAELGEVSTQVDDLIEQCIAAYEAVNRQGVGTDDRADR